MIIEYIQEFVITDYTKKIVFLAVIKDEDEKETVVGMGQYEILPDTHIAEVAFVVRDEYQNKGIGLELLSYLTYLAKNQGLLGFTAEVLFENRAMRHLFENMFPNLEKRLIEGIYELRMDFFVEK